LFAFGNTLPAPTLKESTAIFPSGACSHIALAWITSRICG
jgi:hypothetical protein